MPITEMIRTCPKCFDYYAEELLAFCPADGTPLVEVKPQSEHWTRGVKALEEKEKALEVRARRLKWQRIMLRAMTMLMTAMVVFVIVMNGLVYLAPKREESGPDKPPEQPKAVLDGSNPASNPREPVFAPNPWPKVSPTPDSTPTTTEIVKPTPVPDECTEADRKRERESIERTYAAAWGRDIEAERQGIIKDNTRKGAASVEAVPSPLKYESAFFKSCRAAVITIGYTFQVTANFNGTIKTTSVVKGKRFDCEKGAGGWLCRASKFSNGAM